LNKKIIYLDVDQVLCQWVEGFSNYLYDVYQLNLKKGDILYYEYISDKYKNQFDEFYQCSEVYGTYVKAFEGADEFVDKLRKNYEVKFITNTHPSDDCILDKNYYLGVCFDAVTSDIIHSPRKYLHMTKNDVLVDDKIWNCYQHSSINNGHSILFNHNGQYPYCSYNKYCEFSKEFNMWYSYTYNGVINILEEYI
jgi:5'(3')-deoxyribonucleotidase